MLLFHFFLFFLFAVLHLEINSFASAFAGFDQWFFSELLATTVSIQILFFLLIKSSCLLFELILFLFEADFLSSASFNYQNFFSRSFDSIRIGLYNKPLDQPY